jgi:hypothetical protein
VNLVNTDGLVIFGPGSEWFWSMAQFIVVVATLLAIYLQVRGQRAASLYEQSAAWEREWNDEQFMVSRLATLIDLEGRPPDSGLPLLAAFPGNYFDRLGYLVGQGHLRSVDIWHVLRSDIGIWWALLAPHVRAERTSDGSPPIFTWFEKLELEMQGLDRKLLGRAVEFQVGDASVRQGAEQLTARLRLHADARKGIFPTVAPPQGKTMHSPGRHQGR